METRIYKKENNLKILQLFKASLKDIYNSRFLARQLAERDIKAQYRQSYLGIIWAFITPLTTAFVWIFLSSSGTVKLSDTGVPYPVYAFSGTLIWSIFKEALSTPTASTNNARSILSKINFPKEALIISGIYKMLFNSAFKVGLLIVLMVIYKIGYNWCLILFPLALLAVIFLGITIGLILTPFSMLYKDVGRIINLGLSLLMYITPVVYVVPKTGLMNTLMTYNPLTPIMEVTRTMLFGGEFNYIPQYILVLCLSVPILCVGLIWYRISIPVIVERSSS